MCQPRVNADLTFFPWQGKKPGELKSRRKTTETPRMQMTGGKNGEGGSSKTSREANVSMPWCSYVACVDLGLHRRCPGVVYQIREWRKELRQVERALRHAVILVYISD